MKTTEKLASGWLLLLGFAFLLLPGAALLDNGSTQNHMQTCTTSTGNEARDAALGGLILGVPSVLLGGLLALGAYRDRQQEKKAIAQQASDRLQSTFFRLIKANNGYINVLQFAMEGQLTATAAKQYLNEKAQEFDATFDVSNEGAISYYFPGLNTPSISAASFIAKEHKFNIILEDYGSNKLAVIKAIRELTDLNLKQAKDLVESTPIVIKTGIAGVVAQDIKKQFEEVGAKVSIL